jgi:multiple sugar transport system permease protein
MSRPFRHQSAEARAAALLLAPGLLVITVLFLLPAGATFLLSLTDFDIYAFGDLDTVRVVGLANYSKLVRDPLFWKALRNTLYLVLVGGPLTVAVALGAALLIEHPLARARSFFRTVYFAPVVTTLVAVAVVWQALYHPRYGLLNAALGAVGIPGVDWLGDPRWAMPAMILLGIWKNFGLATLVFIAALQGIPQSLYEAARIDGAGALQRFRHVTFPMLGPALLFVSVLTMINYFQFFAEPYVMTRGGGPLNATLSLTLHMYKEGFRWWNMGYAAAIAFVLFLLILAATGLQIRWRGRATE